MLTLKNNSLLTLALLMACNNGMEQVTPTGVISKDKIESEDLQGIWTGGLHYIYQEVEINVESDVWSDIPVEYEIIDPNGNIQSRGTLEVPDNTLFFIPNQIGSWTVQFYALEKEGYNINATDLESPIQFEVIPSPICDVLFHEELTQAGFVQPDEVYETSTFDFSCSDNNDLPIGGLSRYTITAEQGGFFDGDPNKIRCEWDKEAQEFCELTITGNGNLILEAEGFLYGKESQERYPTEYRATLERPVGYTPEMNCSPSSPNPTVSTPNFEFHVTPTVTDESQTDVVMTVSAISESGMIHSETIQQSRPVNSGSTWPIDLEMFPVYAGAGGVIEFTASGSNEYGLVGHCSQSVPVDELLPYGNSIRAESWQSYIETTSALDFDGPFELRTILHTEGQHEFDGTLFIAQSSYSHFKMELVGDEILLNIRAMTIEGEYREEQLSALFSRIDNQRFAQEIRVEVGLNHIILFVDGLEHDRVDDAFDFSELSESTAHIAKIPMIELDSLAFLPGPSTSDIPWSSPCNPTHLNYIQNAWCLDGAELEPGHYNEGDTFSTSYSEGIFHGSYLVAPLED